MAMQEVVCADCGAINRLVADTCWRCLERLNHSSEEITAVEPRPGTP